jgi:hypothetical protein
MADDARTQLKEHFAEIAAKSLARLHEIHPRLQGKTLEETVAILRAEEFRQRCLTGGLNFIVNSTLSTTATRPARPPDDV